MLDNIHAISEWYDIDQVQFSFAYPHQVRKISVCQIQTSRVYDDEKKPVKGGLYDPRLGVSPNDRDAICPTCGLKGLQCAGHPGHIQLVVPTYNPLVIDVLLKLLRMNCFHCHRLRIRPKIKEDYTVVLGLLKKDRIKEAYQFFDINTEEQIRRLQKLQKLPQVDRNKAENQNKINQCKARLQYAKKMRQEVNQQESSAPTSSSIQLFSQFIKFLNSLAQKKCPYLTCKKQSVRVKKQGANKFFLMAHDNDNDEQQTSLRKKSRDTTSRGQTTSNPTNITHQKQSKTSKQKYITSKDVFHQLRKLWKNQSDLLKVMFGNESHHNSFTLFFINAVFVPPSRFRPESKLGQQKYLHDHTTVLARIVEANLELKSMMVKQFKEEDRDIDRNRFQNQKQLHKVGVSQFKKTAFYQHASRRLKTDKDYVNKWLGLQDSINCFIDATKSSRQADRDFKGVRQILEKKEGLFRMKMMGKRVNYAARSVISPDPSLNTDQVGVPIFMAKKLTFCENVNQYNLQKLQSYVINGKKYPGANFIQQNGKLFKLDGLTQQQRISHARNLWNNHENKVVYRHILTGDNVLFNRQPTLHKPGLMAHRVKVLPRQSTLRMNYANCKSYNADFDGDQMNMHALQTYMAKAQAQLCISDQMYENPANGKPLRQLIQDSIVSAAFLCMRDIFFEKAEYSQLLYQAVFSCLNDKPKNTRIFLLKPAIQKPKLLWTGKQLISNVIKLIVHFSDLKFKDQRGLSMKSQTKISKDDMRGFEQDSQVVFVDNQLLKGFIDKSQVGSGSDYGFIHSFTEVYGEATTGKLMTSLNKLFLNYMQVHGFTCGLDDLILKSKVNNIRRDMLQKVHQETVDQICKGYGEPAPKNISYMGRNQYICDQEGNLIADKRRQHVHSFQEIVRYFQYKVVNEQNAHDQLDAQYKHHLHPKASQVNQMALKGFQKKFPRNNFSMMTITGAKGSNLNHSQIAVMLGQQELQGKRVPVMITGKTLPSFTAYDPNPRASGFIADRFLSGLREQQFYFHCMAGRQGLIDTAVKTSKSGYLQRCLMKHLQSLKVQYDLTVRDSDGSIVQFLYGQDGLNPSKQKFFSKIDLLLNNRNTFKAKLKHDQFKDILKTSQINQFKARQQKGLVSNQLTIHDKFRPSNNLGAISERAYNMLKKMKADQEFKQIFALKYQKGLVDPGEAVGCTAAQSIGQPSTQMTLNTFHLAGHGGVNLTLGIPRLRQLLMTSSDKIKTPIMELSFNQGINMQQAKILSKQLQRVRLRSLIKRVGVEQWKQLYSAQGKLLDYHDRKRYYKITIEYEKEDSMKVQYQLNHKEIQQKIKNILIPQLLAHITRVKKRTQLRAVIKRVTQKQVEEQEENQNEEAVEKQSNEEGQEQKPNQEAMQDENDKNQQEAKPSSNNYNSSQFQSSVYYSNHCEITVKVALSLKKFLMTKVVQKLLGSTIMKQLQGINSVALLNRNKDKPEKPQIPYLQTQGVNFDIFKNFDFLDWNKLKSNDIQAISKKFGIQAARKVLIDEIVNLFKAYGVQVDYRHLYLIGDYVSFGGVIKAMNRNWMKYNPSPFLRMTFETSVSYIKEAALHCDIDRCKTPSSKIIMGQLPQIGTGMHDILMETDL